MAWDAPTEEGFYGPDLPYTITVAEPYFKTDPRYNDGETLLLAWKGPTDSDDPEFEEHEITFTVGKNWETTDGGKTAERVDGKGDKVNSNTGLGRLLERCVGKNPDLKDNFDGILDILEKRGEPTEAKIWEGLKFVIDQEDKDFGGDIGVVKRPMPVEFAGLAEEGAKTGKASKGSGSSKSKGPSKANVRKELVKLAQDYDEYEEFLAEALDVDGLNQYEDLMESVQDESEEGFFAQNKE